MLYVLRKNKAKQSHKLSENKAVSNNKDLFKSNYNRRIYSYEKLIFRFGEKGLKSPMQDTGFSSLFLTRALKYLNWGHNFNLLADIKSYEIKKYKQSNNWHIDQRRTYMRIYEQKHIRCPHFRYRCTTKAAPETIPFCMISIL